MFSWINLSGSERKENDCVVSSLHHFPVCVSCAELNAKKPGD